MSEEETKEEENNQEEKKTILTSSQTVAVTPEQAEAIRNILANKKSQADLEVENAWLKQQLEKKSSEGGGTGTLPANLGVNNSEAPKEFNSFPELVEYYRINEPETYKKLFQKGLDGLRQNPQSFEYSDKWENGTSAIHKVLEKQNERVRGKK